MNMKFDPALWTRPTLQLEAFTLLLIVTPFLLLRSYLQTAMGLLSRYEVSLAGHSVLLMPIVGVAVVAAILWLMRRHLNRRSLSIFALMIAMWLLGQQVADYYFGHVATDIQHNWHSIAYCLFAMMFWRAAMRRGVPPERAILPGVLTALAVSTLDEAVQVVISTRIFDIGDIGKDGWGVSIGLTAAVLYAGWPALKAEGFRITRPSLRDYRAAAFPQLVFSVLFAFILLNVGSLLTEAQYLPHAVLLTVGIFLALFFSIHLLGKSRWRWPLLALLALLAAAQAWAFATQPRGRVQYIRRNLVVYSGIPLPIFDVLIHENGTFRPVDKKHAFNKRDQQTLLSMTQEILLIGSGTDGKGGQGFPEQFPVQFLPDLKEHRAVQLIVLPNPQAIAVYNRLRDEGRRVTFVIHTGC